MIVVNFCSFSYPRASAHLYFVRFFSYLLFFLVSMELSFSSLFSICELYLIFDTRRRTEFSSALTFFFPWVSLSFFCVFFYSRNSWYIIWRGIARGIFARLETMRRENWLCAFGYFGTSGNSGGFWANRLTVYSNCKSSKLKMRDWKPKIGHLPASYPNSPILNR